MRLTTLGTGTIGLDPARMRAGHLVETGDVRLLLDCGSGIIQRLSGRDWMGITHVAITHFHADHVGDLPTLILAWKHGALPARSAPVEILGPPGTGDLMQKLAAAFGDWVVDPGFPLVVREIEPGSFVELPGELALEACKVPHTDESIAYSIRHNGRRMVYSGDTGPDAGFAEWAAGCDLLLCECSLPLEMAIPTHLTPQGCGEIAAVARPGLLVLTHFYPPVESTDVAAAVAERWDGSVVLADDGWTIEL